MSKGLSLHIGVNLVDKNHYGDIVELKACIGDAKFWEGFAKKLKYKTKSLHNNKATSAEVLAILKTYSDELKPGYFYAHLCRPWRFN